MVVRAAGTAIGIGTRASAGTRTGLAFGQLLLSLNVALPVLFELSTAFTAASASSIEGAAINGCSHAVCCVAEL